MPKVKIGFAVTALPPYYDTKYARKNADEILKHLESLDVEVLEAESLVTSWQEAKATAEKFRKENVDLLLILCGTFTLDDLLTAIVKEIDVPLMIWAIPEPPLKGGPLPCGSLLAAVMNGSAIRRMGKHYDFLYGKPNDAKLLKQITRIIKVTQTIKNLKVMRIGMVGYRPPGFYACTFDELELRNSIGPEIVHIDLSEVLGEFDKVSHEETVVADVKKRFRIDGPTQEDMTNTAKLYLSLRKIVEREKLTCTAIKCWPELRDQHDMGACFTLSRLNDEGIMSACEADIYGAVTMSMLHSLTGKIVYFTDLISIDEKKNTFLMWHCGSTPTKLAEAPSSVTIRRFSIPGFGRGVTTEFPIKPGRVTIARLSAIKDSYRMFICGGEALKTEMVVRGNPSEVKLDSNVREVLGKIVTEGFEHHYAVVHADVKEELIELCNRLKIEAVVT
jgi:L-fucose isomerase-like protein